MNFSFSPQPLKFGRIEKRDAQIVGALDEIEASLRVGGTVPQMKSHCAIAYASDEGGKRINL